MKDEAEKLLAELKAQNEELSKRLRALETRENPPNPPTAWLMGLEERFDAIYKRIGVYKDEKGKPVIDIEQVATTRARAIASDLRAELLTLMERDRQDTNRRLLWLENTVRALQMEKDERESTAYEDEDDDEDDEPSTTTIEPGGHITINLNIKR